MPPAVTDTHTSPDASQRLPTLAQALQADPGRLPARLRGAAEGLGLWAPKRCWAVPGTPGFLGILELTGAVLMLEEVL